MADPITVNGLNQQGRVLERDPNLGNTFSTLNADFSSSADITVQFGVQSQGQTFGTVRSMFIDNGDNPSEVQVYVSVTDQFFTVPDGAIGVFTVDAASASSIRLISAGGSPENQATVIFYNWERPPVVWYKFGPFNTDKPIKVEGTMTPDLSVAAQGNNLPVYFGGIDGTGVFRAIRTDNIGRLDFSGANITLGGIFGADPMGAPPINPGVVLAGVDNGTGNLIYLNFTSNNEATVFDATTHTLITATNVAIASTNTKLDTLIAQGASAPNSTTTSVVSAAADTPLLASNVNRKGGFIFNNSTAILYLLLEANGSSTTVFSTILQAGQQFEIGNYTGAICGYWAAANGNAKVTELT